MEYEIIGEVKDPVTVDEAKTHLRVVSRSDDSYIGELIRAAREMAEAFMGRACCLQTVREYLTEWPCDGIFVPSVPRFRELTSFGYRDENGDDQTINVSLFYINNKSVRGKFRLKETETRPTLHGYGFNPITIEYTAGWNSPAADPDDEEEIPALVKQGIKEHVADMYVNRVPVNIARDGRIAVQIPGPIQRLYGPYRLRA